MFVGFGEAKGVSSAGKIAGLSETKLAESINSLRGGIDITVNSIKHARQILNEMTDLRPHVDKFPSNSGGAYSNTIFGDLYKQPRGTYRGDLMPLTEGLYKRGLIHEGGNVLHNTTPHYNIRFFNGQKSAIIIN